MPQLNARSISQILVDFGARLVIFRVINEETKDQVFAISFTPEQAIFIGDSLKLAAMKVDN